MKKTTIILKPTSECNFRCKYCYHADTHYEHGKMKILKNMDYLNMKIGKNMLMKKNSNYLTWIYLKYLLIKDYAMKMI